MAFDEVLLRAGDHVERARLRLLDGAHAVDDARVDLEAAVATLEPAAADDGLPRAEREEVERWRASLASHLLAARDVDEAGAARATVARLLLRATVRPAGRTGQPTVVATACSTARRTSASSASSVTLPPAART